MTKFIIRVDPQDDVEEESVEFEKGWFSRKLKMKLPKLKSKEPLFLYIDEVNGLPQYHLTPYKDEAKIFHHIGDVTIPCAVAICSKYGIPSREDIN